MLSVDENGWLKTDSTGDPEIRIVPTRRCYHLLEPPCDGASAVLEHPLAWVWHTTDLTVSMGDLARRIADATRKGTSSWNVGLARDGVIWQSAPLTVGTWHVGNSGRVVGRDANNINRCTTGCELESPGRLIMGDGHLYCDPYYRIDPSGRPNRDLGLDPSRRLPEVDPYGQRYEVVSQPRRAPFSAGYWPRFTDAQVAGAEALVRAVSDWCLPLRAAKAWRYGHVDFPGRTGKEDPGPLWPAVRDDILNRVGLT